MDVPINHPWVIAAGVFVGVVTALGMGFRKLVDNLQPVSTWWHARELRRIERQRLLEQAALILNDQRVEGLSGQLTGVAEQMERNARQSREEAQAYQRQIVELREQLTITQGQLAAALSELTQLRAELASYRGEH